MLGQTEIKRKSQDVFNTRKQKIAFNFQLIVFPTASVGTKRHTAALPLNALVIFDNSTSFSMNSDYNDRVRINVSKLYCEKYL